MRISIVMPSWKNEEMRNQSLETMVKNTVLPLDIYQFPTNENYGWMKGCNLGIQASTDHDYTVLANDDILVPGVCDWANIMVNIMEQNKDIGALSCLTMNAMGWAKLNINNCTMKQPYEIPYCSFFFVMLRNEAVKKVGMLDESLPGGDDLDYCLRLKEAGYKIAITPQVFVWHHYAQTGKKVYGEYWDSKEHTEKINNALIKKHGFKKYIYNQTLEVKK